MGVKKLQSLVNRSNVLEDFTVTKSHVVIDAANVYYFLYFKSDPQLDQSHGGDYPGFKDETCRFFQALQDCEITPHVVLDGGSDREKLETLECRLKSKLNNAKNIAEKRPGGSILPPLVKDVFKQILMEKNIEFEQSCGEADPRIASWANELQCPVLSDDSDFYIYDLNAGVLSPALFQWRKSSKGQIPAKIYRRSRFCDRFGIDPVLVPVFASIAGNDFSKLEDGGTFERRCPPPERSRDKETNRLRGILRFLKSLKLEHLQNPEQRQSQALAAALRFVGKEKTTDDKRFRDSIKEYVNHPETPETRGDDLPRWIREKLREGKLTSFVTDVLRHSRMMLTPLVEDFSQPSSYAAALRIRRFFYGLLTGEKACTEFDRVDEKSVSHKQIDPLLPSVSRDELLQLQTHLDQAPEVLRRQVLLEALDSRSLVLEKIPDNMKLTVCVTNFWYHQKTNVQYLHGLLLGFVYGEHLNPEGGFEKKMKDLKAEGERIQLQPDVAHAFSQWQCCFRQSLHLNQLLSFPLPEPECSRYRTSVCVTHLIFELENECCNFVTLLLFRLYCGPLVHLLTGPGPQNPQNSIRGLMNEDQRRLFDTLLMSITAGVESVNI
ncbi:protein asteroid homolog 1-like isoform X1 [Anabas testudineus]|uniref:protein asteroid homolog 1-like isoform X1 n=1 Tax=Anabas testudineus TaxID=64144 RepID=UPI000E465627|nr:protein asteroid homolog 1-like isoform X1 [Anabas testudineus]